MVYNNDKYRNITDNIAIDNLPDFLSVSTMTINCKLDTNIHVQYVKDTLTHPKIKIRPKIDKITKKEKSFCNQTQLEVYVSTTKIIVVKLFKNGSLHLTGCKTTQHIVDALRIVCEGLQNTTRVALQIVCSKLQNTMGNALRIVGDSLQLVDRVENVKLEKIFDVNIRMINSNFNAGFLINREALYNILRRKGSTVFFEPCIHAAVNIKYIYGPPETQNVVSIFVFEKGPVIITGAKTKDHIVQAYRFINKILYENFDEIKKNDAIAFLDKLDLDSIN